MPAVNRHIHYSSYLMNNLDTALSVPETISIKYIPIGNAETSN